MWVLYNASHERINNNGTKPDGLHYKQRKYILYIAAYIFIWFLKISNYMFIYIYIVSWETKLHTTGNKRSSRRMGQLSDIADLMQMIRYIYI